MSKLKFRPITDTNIANLRIDNDLTQHEVAKKLNVLRTTYSKWEYLINDIPLIKCNELSNLYDVSIDFLLGLSKSNFITERKNLDLKLMCDRLIFLRKKHHLTQQQLSDIIGFHQRTYSHYETGSNIPTTFKLLYLATFYDVSFDYLVGRTNRKNIL